MKRAENYQEKFAGVSQKGSEIQDSREKDGAAKHLTVEFWQMIRMWVFLFLIEATLMSSMNDAQNSHANG